MEAAGNAEGAGSAKRAESLESRKQNRGKCEKSESYGIAGKKSREKQEKGS